MPITPIGPSSHITALATALTDIRAALEAQLRTLTQAQACVDYYRNHDDRDALTECLCHVDELLMLVPETQGTLTECVTALQRVMERPRS